MAEREVQTPIKLRRYGLVIPVYNNLSTLPDTLASVLQLDNRSTLELVVSDDASTDGSHAFLNAWFEQYGSSFRQATLLVNAANQGISANHARAFAEVKSEYGLYIGGDDLLCNPRMFDDIDAHLDSARRVAIAKLDVEALHQTSGRRARLYQHKTPFFRMAPHRQFAALALFGNFLYAGPGTLLHVPTLRRIGGGFDSRFRTYEDLPLFLAFLTAGYSMRFVPVRGVVWVRTPSSLSLKAFAGSRSRFERENELVKDSVRSHWSMLSPKDKLLFRAGELPKYLRYVLFACSYSWLRFRLVPSAFQKIEHIIGR